MKQLLWYLLAGTRGGETRCLILSHLLKKPSNANQLTTALKLDYKTIRHHLHVLEKNRMIMPINKGGYGAVFFVTPEFESVKEVFVEICWKPKKT